MHIEFTYVGGFETTVSVPDDQPLKTSIESVLLQVKPGNPHHRDTPVRVLINGGLIPEEDYSRVPSKGDFVKIEEIQGSYHQTLPVVKSDSTNLSWVRFFLWWPWKYLMERWSKDPPNPVVAAVIVACGITLQILVVAAVYDRAWGMLLGLVLLYYIVTRLQYKKLKKENGGAVGT